MNTIKNILIAYGNFLKKASSKKKALCTFLSFHYFTAQQCFWMHSVVLWALPNMAYADKETKTQKQERKVTKHALLHI